MNSLLIAANILKRTLKSKKEIAALLLLPILALVIMTLVTAKSNQEAARMQILNQDQGPLGRVLISKLEDQNLSVVALGQDDFQKASQNSNNLILVLPAEFSSNLVKGEKMELNLWGNEKSPLYEQLKAKINRQLLIFYAASSLANKQAGGPEPVEALLRASAQSRLTSSYLNARADNTGQFLVTSMGFTLMFMMILVLTTVGSILEDKRKLILARICAAPVRQWEIAAGNLLGSLSLGVLQLIPLQLTVHLAYGLSWQATFAVFLTLISFLLAAIGLGIGLSGIIRHNFNPTLLIATVIVPTCILGGAFIPEAMLPAFMVKLGYATPQRWTMHAITEILGGAGLSGISVNWLINIMFGLALASFGIKTLRPLSD